MNQPDPTGVAVHRRTVSYEATIAGPDELLVIGTFCDERPWSPTSPPGGVLHRMTLEATVRPSERTIMSARATMSAFPHAECPAITPAFEQLVGLRVVGGYGREIRERFSGVKGCAHLHELARGLGPAVVQALMSWTAWHRPTGAKQAEPSPGALNSCHVWATGGVGEQKLAAGWRIQSGGPYPVPPVSAFQQGSA